LSSTGSSAEERVFSFLANPAAFFVARGEIAVASSGEEICEVVLLSKE